MKRVLLLGVSGNIGTQALDVLGEARDSYCLEGISVGRNSDVVDGILKDFPTIRLVYLIDSEKAGFLRKRHPSIRFFSGEEGLGEIVEAFRGDIVLNAILGFAGLLPSLRALEKGKVLALANKESLVVGGALIPPLLERHGGSIIPIDSEHVAFRKCLNKARGRPWKKFLITASGGAFRDFSREEARYLPADCALVHPTWKMGKKITIDSATMFNKGFEIIEAMRLFSIKRGEIEVLMHRESLVHSAILLEDGKYLADVGKPDMREAIRFALEGGTSSSGVVEVSSLDEIEGASFAPFSSERFPAVSIALEAERMGGDRTAVLNGADEEAVARYLKGEIGILGIEKAVALALHEVPGGAALSYDALRASDRNARSFVRSLPASALN